MQLSKNLLVSLLLLTGVEATRRNRKHHLKCHHHGKPKPSFTSIGVKPTSTVAESTETSIITEPIVISTTSTEEPAASTTEAEETTTEAEETTTEVKPSTTTEEEAKPTITSKEEPKPKPTDFKRAYPADKVDDLRDESIKKLRDFKKGASGKCTLENASIRYEWSDLSVSDRESYVKAVQCLMDKPALTPSSHASGAKSRYDDFVVTHIEQTGAIHNTANFLSWHRYYTHAYETALREECGYKGHQPYWNWARYADDPANSPIFDGSSSSLGGNSKNGGCADAGPFSELQVNVGPGSSVDYNPRCLKRDISRSNAQQCTVDKTLPLITDSNNVADFQERMQTPWGVHAGGHFTIGGDPGGDIFTSPGDPAFFLHHAMIDRVWWIWQMQDLESRLGAVAGSVAGSSRQGSVSDKLNLGYSGDETTIGKLLDTLGGLDGELCYIYM